MHDMKKNGPPMCWRAVWLAVVAMSAQGAVFAQAPAPSASTPAAAPAAVAPESTRKVDIAEYIVRGNTVLDARAIEKAVTPFLGPDRTLKDVEGARDALLAAYQAAGYQSVYVDLPEQQVTQGIVFLQVNETRVGRVRVVGAEYNSPLDVRDQVPALKEGGVPNFNTAQAELSALNRSPKRQVMPLVRQGSMPGTMDVDLKVDDSNPWRASVGLNNDYSADTRKLRATASLGHDNLWQLGHSASISFFGAPQDLSQTKVISASYNAPLAGTNWSLEGNAYVSDSDVATTGGTNVLGKGHSIGLKATYTVPNTGNWWHAFSVGVDFKNNEEALRLKGSGDTVPLKYAPITLSYSGFRQSDKSQYGVGVSLVVGTSSSFGYSSDWAAFDYKRYKASPSFMVLKTDLNGTYTFDGGQQLAARFNAQMTDAPLVSSEQIAGGGMNSVRGYLSAEVTGDYGVVGSLELRSQPITLLGPLVENWRVYAFADAARLRLKSPLPEQNDKFLLASVGLGTTFKVGQYFSGRVDFGYPLKDGPRTKRHDSRVNFSLTANY
ncbi:MULTISPECIES: ShlB/FhaC/HecB family hemolysin secretion/activation protein [Variovorax]|jgi:hemolysin activation/secretion protein|uniref:ShlB/FhaC/HecB family hemolysin secretion/activation protein n=2 Tax=Comamonadaceae TaxID=80864 RepID=UPI000AACA5D9|nr:MULTISPECIES: ShlB/FhaC/HecB family hemolysin secretion/activation protein [Variovorax]MBN8758137.1 ShlB/FhaC/HecB family hemolysin secretion/activation protein [Variovorax sp.]UKI11057.1 ShlB/FhaC/HecB family hemolysin secretion/activation protein [Variovorax paradoxus]